ncbi:MAG: Gp37 family protein [Melioribacteraceae bacterium]|nr:Gp37 family protein [Melioribacteraceae bacterium]MCF8414562.1 Gp37 family protein [Melioribacteraceae bacterium]
MPESISKNKDAFKLFKSKLETAIEGLNQGDKVEVERLPSLDGYELTHPRGVFGLINSGGEYNQREDVGSSAVIMKHDLMIGVVSIIRFWDKKDSEIDDTIMYPDEYAELAVDAISGIKIENKRPESEQSIIPVRTELIDEDGGVWKYLTTFKVPIDFIEKSLQQ